MQLVQSNDRANRLSFKGALAHKVEAALSAPDPETVTPNQVLLLPTNFQDLSETDLHFTLMHNKELKHSRETANLATEIVFNKTLCPKTVQFQTVALSNPVALPQFEKKVSKRTAARKIVADDSTAIRMQAEKDKEASFKAYIDGVITRAQATPSSQGAILRVPKNYNDFSEAELFHVLTHTTELEHSRNSAYLAMDILSGKINKPVNVTLQSISLPNVVPTTSTPVKVKEVVPSHIVEAERGKREQFKANLADKASVISKIEPNQYRPVTLFRLPAHYEELSQAGLFYTLTHNPELQHTTETANLAIAFLSGVSTKPEWVEFQTIEITAPVEVQAQTIAKVDHLKNFIPEREIEKRAQIKGQLAAKTETAFQAKPEAEKTPKDNTIHRLADLPAPKAKPVILTELKKVPVAIHPDILANEDAKRVAHEQYLSAERVSQVLPDEETILRLPKNYKELSQDELLYVLTRSPELKHSMDTAYLTLDIMSGKVSLSSNVKFHAVEIQPILNESPSPVVKAARTASLHPEVKAADRPKRQLFKEELADRAREAFNAKPVLAEEKPFKTILVPEGYESMTPGELHFALVRNPELKHSQESARYAVDILDGKIKNAPVKFAVVILENPELAPATLPRTIKPKTFNTEKKSAIIINRPTLLTKDQLPFGEGERVLKIPHNYEELNETQLHFALSHNREYGHSFESTYETLDILYGRNPCPSGTVFSTIEVVRPVERAY